MKKLVICLMVLVMFVYISSNFVVSAATPKNNVTTIISKMESKEKGFKVVWKKKSKINGYQIRYSPFLKLKRGIRFFT